MQQLREGFQVVLLNDWASYQQWYVESCLNGGTPLILKDNPVLNSEIWKDVVGFEGVYQVSDLGRVRNSRGMIMKFFTNNSRYFV